MGEEEKKPTAENKQEEVKKPPPPEKKEEAPKVAEDGKKSEAAPPPPPPQIVLKVFMHCEGCARKVRRCLKGFEGVEEVITDCKTSKVIVKGEKADPAKVLERVQKKSHRQVELISPIPKPPPPPEEKPAEKEAVAKPEEKKPEPCVTIVLGVYMHCEACAEEIKRRILRMKGVESVEPDLKGSQVTVKGVFEPKALTDYVFKRTGKHATIVKVDPDKKAEEKPKEAKGEKKTEEGEKEAKKPEDAPKESGGGEAAAKPEVAMEDSIVEVKKNEIYNYNPHEYQMYNPRFMQDMNNYPPQMFSDENPNACRVM